MDLNKGIKIKALVIAIAIPLAVGGLAALLSGDGFAIFKTLYKPLFSPPGWVFPVVWTILYVMMGVASYLVYAAPVSAPREKRALWAYGLQLLVNFLWPLLFFGWGLYTVAFLWIILLWLLVLLCYVLFDAISRTAGRLMLPLLIWVTFAAYLNLGVALLN